ncbi:hypothetical protein GQ457_09G006950 [Hibiscus cannabinus]
MFVRFGMTFGEVSACCSPDFCNSGVEYRYPIRGIDTQIQHWNLGIGYRYPLVFPLGIGTKGGVSVPKPPLGLEYRYWLQSTDTSCLKAVFGPLET